ncbi:MAG: hypothetical protein HYT14_00735 [Candidatus Liptonbacteria bacterium]|nr:hypothetical protein [Candidatus Liptonbacteria bacterium]
MNVRALLAFALVIVAIGVGSLLVRSVPESLNFSLPSGPSEQPAPRTLRPEPSQPRPATPAPEPEPETDPRLSVATSSIPVGFTREQLSLKFRKVRVSSVTRKPSASSAETLVLSVSLSRGETVRINGWRVETKTNSFTISRIPLTHDPFGGNPPQDLVLTSGDSVRIYGSAPRLGAGFRLNACVGYLETLDFGFRPALPKTCPGLYESTAELSNFSSQCQDYIRSLSSCEYPSGNPPVPADDAACRDFLNAVNYGGCYNAHKNDGDFLSKEVRIWLGSSNKDLHFLNETHDRVLLFDEQGFLVSDYTY